jgi:hypothetical protein
MVSTLQQQLFPAVADGLFYLDAIGLFISDVRFGMTGHPVEITELTIGYADIRCVEVAVDDPGDLIVRFLLHPDLMGYLHKLGQRGIIEQKNAFLHTQEFEIKGFLVKFLQFHHAKV